jgi:hypothetical protein
MIYTILSFFLFLDFTRFKFELINQKMFEMKKITHFTYLVIFHLKVIVYQNVNYQTLHIVDKFIIIIRNHNI